MFNLGTRKLQKLNAGFYINTPLDWVNHHGLKVHEKVEVRIDSENNLIISPIKK